MFLELAESPKLGPAFKSASGASEPQQRPHPGSFLLDQKTGACLGSRSLACRAGWAHRTCSGICLPCLASLRRYRAWGCIIASNPPLSNLPTVPPWSFGASRGKRWPAHFSLPAEDPHGHRYFGPWSGDSGPLRLIWATSPVVLSTGWSRSQGPCTGAETVAGTLRREVHPPSYRKLGWGWGVPAGELPQECPGLVIN